jgi:isochorismate synthase
MSPELFSRLASSEEPCYALREPGAPVVAHWGRKSSPGEESLSYRKFYSPRKKSPSSLWEDFRETDSFSLSSAGTFGDEEPSELPPIPRPAGASPGERQAWDRLCERAANAIERGLVSKLVPARKITFFLTPNERTALLERIAHRLFLPPMENAYRFLLKEGQSVFFGATPELLFRREKGEIFVPAIAGTRALGSGRGEGELRESLLSSAKDRAEHNWVVSGIRDTLASLGLDPQSVPEPEIMRTSRLLHLYTPIRARDPGRISSERVMEALHPTPAIGGQPQEKAMDFLFENENWDRGLFSAPLLFRSSGRELCLVAIRSALLQRNELHFFAGAGYVKGSTPESEWRETESKLRVMQCLLFGDEDAKPH